MKASANVAHAVKGSPCINMVGVADIMIGSILRGSVRCLAQGPETFAAWHCFSRGTQTKRLYHSPVGAGSHRIRSGRVFVISIRACSSDFILRHVITEYSVCASILLSSRLHRHAR